MADFEGDPDDAGASGKTIDDIAEEVRDDIHLGHIEDDVAHVLEERLKAAGIVVRPEEIDTLADEIENDSSR